MWRRMKKKVYDFFFYETIETIELIDEEKKKQQHSSTQNDVETRIAYQYPEKKEFRFPLIPDMEETRTFKTDETLDIPAYMRKERPVKQEERTYIEEDKQSRDKQPRENKKRFVPTDVPSPIYGYQRRKKEQAIQNTPAYLRRQRREEVAAVHEEEMVPEEPSVEESVHVEDRARTDVSQIDERNNEPTHTIHKDEAQLVEPVEEKVVPLNRQEPAVEEKKVVQERKRVRPSKKQESKSSSSGEIPFNVMMTRQDKARYEQQKYQQAQSNEMVPEPEVVNEVVVEEPVNRAYDVPIHLLDDPQVVDVTDQEWLIGQQHLLEETFTHFNVEATVVNVTQGPSVTRFEVQPALGVKVSKVRNLSDDIKLNLAAKDIRIEAPIPGKNTIGIEIPNLHGQTVGLYEILHGDAFMKNTADLPIGLGVTIEGEPLITDIARMPHGLIAGATGSGKSVCINTILLSLLYHAHYDDVKMLLIDPKMVELTPYNGIPHLVSPVITDVKAATAALQWAVEEMEKRYEHFVKEGVRDINRFNEKVKRDGRISEKMPFIVIVIDELADLMMVAPQDVEDSICRIAQKARACGMHLLIATQRPSVDVITGLIKANVPTRIAFSVSSQVDSRTIIDTNGAERLLGKGDMLFVENGSGKSIRLQGAFVSDDEIDRVVQNVKQMAPPQYLFEEEELLEMTTEMDDDPLLEEATTFVIEQNRASTSMIQRQFRVGYNRAARLMEALEQRGIISGQNGSKPRDVLVRK